MIAASSSNAQDMKTGEEIRAEKPPAFKKGSTTVAFGAGFGGFKYYVRATEIPFISISIDNAQIENVGIGTIGFGVIGGLKTAEYTYPSGKTADWVHAVLATRATYHFVFHHAFDPYAGVTLGAKYTYHNDATYISTSYKRDQVKFVGGVFIGAKYNLARWFGLFAEAGIDITRFRVGFNFNKLN